MAEQLRQAVLQITDLHRRLGQVIRRVALSNEHFVVEKGGLPVAVLMSFNEYERLMRDIKDRQHKELVRALGQEAERQGYTEEQLIAELKEDRRLRFQEEYGDLAG